MLGPRLRECVDLVNRIEGRTLLEIFGDPDRMKFGSCMTLFERVAPDEPGFGRALDRYCDGAATRARSDRKRPDRGSAEMGAAGRAQLRTVPRHAGGDFRDIGNMAPAEPHRVVVAVAALCGEALRDERV